MPGRLGLASLALASVLLLGSVLQTAAQGGSPPATSPFSSLTATGPAAATSDNNGGGGGSSGQVIIINELLEDNKNSVKDEDGSSPSWIELYNGGGAATSLAGYKLAGTPDASDAWTFPSGVSLAPGQYLLLFASGKNRTNPSAPLHTSFKLSADDGYLALLAPGGNVVSLVQFPQLPKDVSFGRIGGAGVVSAAAQRGAQYAVLAAPTPGKDNSGPRPGGPLIVGTTRTTTPRPTSSADITVTTTVSQQQNPLGSVQLVYVAGYGQEVPLPMTASGDGSTYTATIPASAATTGSLVRWYIKATDSQGASTRDPLYQDPKKDRQYWGTIVGDSGDQASLPIMELYCTDDKAPYSRDGVAGCSLWFNGSFYDNVEVGRRGVTSLNWPKPKIKVQTKQGSIFKMAPGFRASEMNLNSEWWEPGENTFMREPLVWQVFGEMGVESLLSFHLHLRLNGKYYGKWAFVEQVDKDTLARWGYPVTRDVGPLWKSTSGEYSNLRWDLPPEHIQYYWKQYTIKGNNASEGAALLDFARGLAGGASVPRSKYLFDAVNLPQVINHMAAQTIVLNQDRCTKNFYIYRDPAAQQWSMFPWDVESGFGIDRGLGGKPAPDYCILACEQWNSPLYCDHNHPQDLAVKTPWGLISAQYDLYTTGPGAGNTSSGGGGGRGAGAGPASSGRKLLAGGDGAGAAATAPMCSKAGPVPRTGGGILGQAARKLMQDGGSVSDAVPQNGAAEAGLSLPVGSAIEASYDVDQTKLGPTKTGAPGTYNYLIDAILAVPRTRQMYMRRLRTLMDKFMASGRLQELVTSMYNQIKDEALRDAQQWNNPGRPDRGYQQLITEQLPIRKDQLYGQYGPQGPIPLIPDAQPGSFQLSLGQLVPGPSGYVQVVNPSGFAADISGYRLQGAVQFTFRPGTVIPAQDSLYAAASIPAFLQRSTAPSGGQGNFVVGPLSGQLLGAAASVQLVNADGTVLAST